MRAKELREHMQKVGTWVDWDRTVDQFLAGNPESIVKKIAVSWMPTFSNLEKALDEGCNVFVTHEPLYAVDIDGKGEVIAGLPPSLLERARRLAPLDRDDPWVRKKRWLDRTEMVVYRCHDFWDDFPELGIHGAWADWLGLTAEPVASKKYYEVHEVGETTLGKLARKILERVRSLGQDAVHVVGDLNKRVSRIAIGTGAITDYREMHKLGADVLLVTDDGARLWECGQWSLDSGVPLIIVNHSASEEPGMRTLARYIDEIFSDVPVVQIPVGCIYKTLG